ncbi:DUF2073 domain-containing protein [Candidatus Woesearchaeota archaeon]|nr:DUF2073 domain-containing protein [Candidatus Woesearchaeota archaeon]
MLTLQFVPHREIEGLDSIHRVNKLLKIVKEEKIILLEGRLKSHEETDLISKTMEEIDNKFKGIELSAINPESSETKDVWQKLRSMFINMVLGDRGGFTIIGPASIIKDIKKDPNKIQLFTEESPKR